MKTIALVDADVLVYQVATMSERPIEWDNDMWTLHSYLPEAIGEMQSRIKQIKDGLKADQLIFALSCADGQYFRKVVYPKYKFNRKAKRKPLVWKPLRDWLHSTEAVVYERPGLEGDDCLGILATMPGNDRRIIASIDKDFKTVPGEYWDLKEQGETVVTPACTADYWFLYQTLTGDQTDGYPGCPTIGPKSAEKTLSPFLGEEQFNFNGAWEAVVKAYAKQGLGEAVAIQMARCARILRASDYDFKERKPLLWEPPASLA